MLSVFHIDVRSRCILGEKFSLEIKSPKMYQCIYLKIEICVGSGIIEGTEMKISKVMIYSESETA